MVNPLDYTNKQLDYTKIFHTVPFSSKELTRTSDGTKTNPGFPDNWIQYQSKRNTKNTPLLGAIARQDFIGIDIDNTPLFKEALRSDNDTCEYVAESDLKGGHLLYTFNEEDYEQLKSISKDAKKANVDIQIDNKLIYLATQANKTKVLLTDPLTQLPQTRIPQNVINLLCAHILRYQMSNPHIKLSTSSSIGSEYNPNAMDNSTLGYLLENPEYTLDDLQTVLPKSLEPKHPKDIPQGKGTDWMTSVRFKLSQDPSVSENDFIRFMLYLNTLWDNPMEDSRVIQDCKYDINNGINKLTDDKLWKYNPEWKNEGFTYPTRNNHLVEVMYDSIQSIYVVHNRLMDSTVLFKKFTDLQSHIINRSKDRRKVLQGPLLKKADPITLVNTPEAIRGKYMNGSEIMFNIFKPSEGVKILTDQLVVKSPRHPETILKFLDHLITDKGNMMRLMKFIAHKHSTYEHSELYFVFAGVGGAGKNVFISTILEYFSGKDRMQPAGLAKLNEGFNAWMSDPDYIIIDEAGEGASKKEQESLVGSLKRITGTGYFTPSRKGMDIKGESIRHYMTPILTTNMSTKLITDMSKNDRRLVLFKSPTRLSDICPNGDTRDFIGRMVDELPHFANYLKSLEPILYGDYRDNGKWKNKDYEEYIQATITPLDKLVESVESKLLSEVVNVLMDFGVHKKDLDSMFDVSLPNKPRFILYHTTHSADSGLKSLVDVLAEIPYFGDADIRNKLKQFATVRGMYIKGTTKYTNIRMVPLIGDYKPFTSSNIEEIKDIDL